MFVRTRAIRERVKIHLDGREIDAERGEPIAASILAAGERVLARSPKLHRPRAPACMRGDCEGCVARVDGVPNIATCMRDAFGGEEISAQNVLGSRRTDLLRVTDWFFARGIDHHHLLAGVPAAGSIMQTFARQMAGIGRLPEAPVEPIPAKTEACDVLVVGAGLAGLACAAALASRDLDVRVVDEGPAPGGSARFSDTDHARVTTLVEKLAGRDLHSRTTVAGVFDGEVLTVRASDDRITLYKPRALVLATGAHDGVLLVDGNDLPGVLGARAVCLLASLGIEPSRGAVVVGAGPWAERTRALLGERVVATVEEKEVRAIVGSSQVKAVEKRDGSRIPCGVVAVAASLAPAFELGVQAGASTVAIESGFALRADEHGRIGDRVWAAGECAGLAFDPASLVRAGEVVASDVASALS
ncbi:MAG: 2Fe-2S iron-sulfur cluster-binding protein [Polyangiaceae bacterium]